MIKANHFSNVISYVVNKGQAENSYVWVLEILQVEELICLLWAKKVKDLFRQTL